MCRAVTRLPPTVSERESPSLTVSVPTRTPRSFFRPRTAATGQRASPRPRPQRPKPEPEPAAPAAVHHAVHPASRTACRCTDRPATGPPPNTQPRPTKIQVSRAPVQPTNSTQPPSPHCHSFTRDAGLRTSGGRDARMQQQQQRHACTHHAEDRGCPPCARRQQMRLSSAYTRVSA